MSGFSQPTRLLIIARVGERCERCGAYRPSIASIHHRRPRGMGGDKSPVTNSAVNGLLLCGSGTTDCHGWVEAHRDRALELGLLVSRYANPAEVPVRLERGWVLLDSFGNYLDVPGATA